MNPHPENQGDLFTVGAQKIDVAAAYRLDTRAAAAVDETKGAVPYKKFPLAEEGTAWGFSAEDGDTLIEKGGYELFGQCHTWKDPDVDPETKAAYKLPTHKIADGEVRTFWRGVAAAMARLLSSTGIPDGDRKAVYNHLAKHYGEFDKPVPEFKSYGPVDAVVAAFGIDGIGELMKILEPHIRKGVELDLEADGLLEVLEGRYDDAGERKSQPDAADGQIFGPEVDKVLTETLEMLKAAFVRDGKGPNPDGSD